MLIKMRNLYQFTSQLVLRAKCVAEYGQKDSARDILRYVVNSRIVDILTPWSGDLGIDAALLSYQVRELEKACHPMTGDGFEGVRAKDVGIVHLMIGADTKEEGFFTSGRSRRGAGRPGASRKLIDSLTGDTISRAGAARIGNNKPAAKLKG